MHINDGCDLGRVRIQSQVYASYACTPPMGDLWAVMPLWARVRIQFEFGLGFGFEFDLGFGFGSDFGLDLGFALGLGSEIFRLREQNNSNFCV